MNPFQIPEDVTCINPYVLTATATVATGIIFYLIKVIRDKDKIIKEKENSYEGAVSNHMNDLKDHAKNIELITQKESNFVVENLTKFHSVIENLKNQITKLQTILSNSK